MIEITKHNIDRFVDKHMIVFSNNIFLGTIVFNINTGYWGIAYNNSVHKDMCSINKSKLDIINEYLNNNTTRIYTYNI